MGARESSDLVMAPVSPGLAKLLHQLHAQIIRDADARAAQLPSPTSMDVELRGEVVRLDFDERIKWVGDNGKDEAAQNRFCPPSWRPEQGTPYAVPWHPSHWRVYRYRVDQQGRQWSLSSEIHVMDDFGALVSVEGWWS